MYYTRHGMGCIIAKIVPSFIFQVLQTMQMPTWVNILMNLIIVHITYCKTVIYLDQAFYENPAPPPKKTTTFNLLNIIDAIIVS